jgi:hypothetical protein
MTAPVFASMPLAPAQSENGLPYGVRRQSPDSSGRSRRAGTAFDRACAQHLATVQAKAVSPSSFAKASEDSATALQRLRVFAAFGTNRPEGSVEAPKPPQRR